jgi:hypothetical protein
MPLNDRLFRVFFALPFRCKASSCGMTEAPRLVAAKPLNREMSNKIDCLIVL